MNIDRLLEEVLVIARAAGDAMMQVYGTEFTVHGKADGSPVTAADEQAERCIIGPLIALTPEIPVVSEEAAAKSGPPAVGKRFWLVDPLDGTRVHQS